MIATIAVNLYANNFKQYRFFYTLAICPSGILEYANKNAGVNRGVL